MSLSLPAPLRREGREVLAIALGTYRKEHVLRMFPDLRSEPGYRVKGQRIEEYRLEGFFNHEGELFLYGPAEAGRMLETVMADRPEEALRYLSRLAAALALLEERGIELERLQTDSVLFLDSGGVLFLPPGVMKRVCELHPISYKLRVFELVNHPDWARAARGSTVVRRPSPSAHLSFSLGALAYRMIVGHYPFEADSEEEVHNQVRHRQLASPALVVPSLRPEVGRFLLRALGKETPSVPTLQEWVQTLSTWQREGLYRSLTDTERAELVEQARAQSERAARAYGRRVFWQRRGLTVLIVTAIVVVAGILAGSYLRNLLQPPATRGFSPRQVVEAYLLSMNTLDHAMMEDCTVEGAGKDTIREVINIYVLSRVTQGYEGRSNVIPADEWDRMGRPPLEPPQTVFGVTDLVLRRVRGEPEPVFEASYTFWTPRPPEEETSEAAARTGQPGAGLSGQDTAAGPTMISRDVSERFYLKLHRGDWAIYRIEPLQSG